MESQPQNPEFRINPENFHPCITTIFSEQTQQRIKMYRKEGNHLKRPVNRSWEKAYYISLG